jgi:hypothetical protein
VDLAALRRAARAAIVMPAVFALADKVIGKPQTSLFAAFGSFALLVLTEFGGPRRARLLAYMGLAGVGATLITLGTLCSRDPWLGAGAMALIGFGTLFAGAFSGYFAAGATGALLTFVLSVTIPAPSSAIPDRLEGWGLATGAGICAAMLLWPRRRPADLRAKRRAHCAPWRSSWRRTGNSSPSAHASRARRSTPSAGVCSAASIARPVPPGRLSRSPRFPTSSTGCSPSSHRRPSCPRSSLRGGRC